MIEFAFPEALWLLLCPFIVYYFLPQVRYLYGDALRVPFVNEIREIKSSSKDELIHHNNRKVAYGKILLLSFIWLCLVISLCRPQFVGEPKRVKNEGRDILLVVDISTSMKERDFVYQGKLYDRLTAVKYVINNFIEKRTEDSIGLVLFGTQAYLQVPLTYDKQALSDVLLSMDAGMAGNSTSIGDAIGVALKNMPSTDSKSKIIILLTDGENNDGSLSMPEAIKLAQDENVKIYTIGVGSDETFAFTGLFNMPRVTELDEKSLQSLSDSTKGSYFRAKDVNSLQQVYDEINKLEPQISEGRFVRETKDLYYYPAILSLLLFLLLLSLMRRNL